MVQLLRGIAVMMVIFANCGFATAEEDTDSANYLTRGCRGFLAGKQGSAVDILVQGECFGQTLGIAFASPYVCRQQGVTYEQLLLVVVKYIDSQPARLHERFDKLALEALRVAWPCKK